MIRATLSLAALALAAGPVASAHGGAHKLAQQTQPTPEVTATDLGSGIYMLVGLGGNIGLLTGEDGVFVIDSQFARIAEENLAKIEEISGGRPTFLVNTHWHGDHVGGNADFGGTIIAHDNVRKRVSTDQTLNRFGNESTTPASPAEAWPVITFGEGLTLHLNGQTVHVFHVPNAHTDGDAMVWFDEADILHMGDTFFKGNFPFIDIFSGGSVAGEIAALEYVYEKIDDDTVIIPGHGSLANKADLGETIGMLKGVRDRVAQAITEGMTLEEAQQANILEPWAEQWGGGFINPNVFTALVYQSLTDAMRVSEGSKPSGS